MSRTILIVDDSKTERIVLRGFLKESYDILEAASGEEALEILHQNYKVVTAIVMDVVMPGQGGFETVKAIRSNAMFSGIPIVITTAMDDEESREKAIACGADNFITKPFNRSLLLHIIENAVRLKETSAIVNAIRRDKLTGLLSAESFYQEAERMIRHHKPGYYILSCINIENFKVVNDQYGTDVGDEVLQHIANTINHFTSGINGICGRYAADKFCFLYPAALKNSKEIARIHIDAAAPKCLRRPIRIRIGRYVVKDTSLPASAMLDRASMAQSLVKGRYDTNIAEYSEAMREALLQEQQIVNSMVDALQNGEFVPWFQPQYNHATGALIGAEALVRWLRDGAVVPPNEFIPVFERNGIIYEVDQSVWRQVCALQRRWIDEGKEPLPISVNISRYDLYQKDFLDVVNGLVKEYALPVDLLRLEITESAFADSTDHITDTVGQLIKAGFTVEIDDFGSGYSSLNTLKDVPASILKLDMRFFEATDNSERGGNIVESIVRMAKWLGMSVIAEGVEDKAQADYLKTIGCYYIQGYYYARPMPVDAYEQWMVANKKEAKLSRVEMLVNLDNNLFWDPKSMETLIFNSYVGGACIFEYSNGKTELLRANDRYLSELHGLLPPGTELKDASIVRFLDDAGKAAMKAAFLEAEKKREVTLEIRLSNGSQTEYIRFTGRIIASTAERKLFYAVIHNLTEQRKAEQVALVASERISAIMENSQCGITAIAIHPDGQVESLFANKRFFDILGYTREQFIKELNGPFSYLHPDDYEKNVAEALRIGRLGETATMRVRAIRRDKRVIWLRADVCVVEFANVPYPVQLSNFLDITEQVEAERKRMESAERLNIIMSNINGSISAVLMDDAGNTRLIFGNEKYYNIFGYTREQAEKIHLDVLSCIVPEDFPGVVARLNQLKKDGVPANIDYRAQRKDGKIIYVRSISSRMSMEGYGDEVIVSVETDITEQRTLEDQLRAIVDNINGGVSAIYLKNDTPEYVIVNDKYFDIIGYTREQFMTEVKNAFDIVHPDDRARVEKLFQEAAVHQKPYSMEYRIIRRNGAIRHILCNTNVMHLFGMEEPVQLAVSNDITVFRETQLKERDLSLQMQTIMEHIHGGVTATVYHNDDDVEIIFANEGFYALYGYTREQLNQELPNMLDLILPEDRKGTMETVARIVRERGCDTYEYRCRKRDGSIMWTQVTNAVISMSGVGDTVLLAIVTDVTALRRAEQQNLEITDRLRAVMNAMSNGVTAVAFHGDNMEFLFANDRYYDIHGIRKDNAQQSELWKTMAQVCPEDRAAVQDMIRGATRVGQRVEAEYRITRPDGAVRWLKAVINVTNLTGVDVPVQVTHFADITGEKEATEQLRFLNDSAHDILAQPDSEAAIRQTLQKMAGYFRADRAYVVELDNARHVTSNTYEVCGDGAASQMENLKDLPFSAEDMWVRKLSGGNFLIVENVGAMDESEAALQSQLSGQGIRSIILAPLQRDGELIGFLGVDNPANAVSQVSQLTAIGDYVSVLLTRRDLRRKIDHDHRTVKQLMDDTPGGFLRMEMHVGASPTVVSFNEGFCKMLGMTGEEVMAAYGDDVYRCLTTEDIEAASGEAAEAYAACGQFTSKCRLLKKDGSLLWVMVFGRFVHDETGKLFLNAYFTDISQQKSAEQLQVELLENLPSGAALYEFNGKTVKAIHINKHYWELVGREALSPEAISVFGVFHPDDRDSVINELKAAIRQNRNAVCNARILCGDGSYKPFCITTNNVREENGNYLLYATFSRISDESMSIQEMLPIALSTMVEASDDMSYVKDRDLCYICVSRSIAAMAGFANPRDLIGKTAEAVFGPSFATKFNEDDRHVLETCESRVNMLEHIPTSDGGVCLARTSKYPILDASGHAIGVYCVSHDITSQKEKESQLELLTSTIPGGLAAYSISGDGLNTLYFNDGYYAYSGYTREEYVAMTEHEPLALMFEEDRPKLLDMVHAFTGQKTDGMTGSCTYRCRTKDGGTRWMSLKAVLSQVGEEAFVLNVVQLDITDRMEAENRRAELLDNLPFGAAMYRFDGKNLTAIHINKQYMRMVNREVDFSLKNFQPANYIHPDDRQMVFDEIRDAIAAGRWGACKVRLLYGGNDYRTFRLDANIVPDEDGTHLLFVAYTPITEQAQSFENMLPRMFAAIMESSTDLAFAKDVNFRYICCSRNFTELLGLGAEKDVVGKTDYELFPKEIADMFRRDDSALFADGKPQVDILEMIPAADGTPHYTRTTKHLLRAGTGEIIGVYCTGRDVTEIREAYAQLKLLTDSIPGGIATFRCMPGHIDITYFNDGICALAGYSREEFLARKTPVLDLVFDEDRPVVRKQIELLQSGETTLNFSFRIHTGGGGYKWINTVATTADHVGDVYDINAVLTDISVQQEEKERLRLAEEAYRLATVHSNRTICRYDIPTQTLTMETNTATRLDLPQVITGVPYERVRLGFISKDTQDAYIHFFESILHGEKEAAASFRKRLKGGWRWINARATAIFNDEGEPVSAIISYSDVTEQREKEAVYSRWQNSLKDRPEDSYTLFRCNISKGASFDSRNGSLLTVVYHDKAKSFDQLTDEYVTQYVYADDRERYRAFMRADTMLAEYYRGHRTDSMEYRECGADGAVRWLRVSVDLVEYPDSSDVEAYMMYENIDKQKRTELRTIEQAETDPLTGVLNRATFALRVNQIIGAAKPGTQHALLMLDVDGFKQVNDVFGHGAGDMALNDIADLLTKSSRENDLVGRLGGDEFLLFLPNISGETAAASKARQICELARRTFSMEVQISGSVGIALYPRDGEGFEALYKVADEALYRVKGTGKNGFAFSHGEPVAHMDARMETVHRPKADRQSNKVRRMLIVDDNPVDLAVLERMFRDDFRIEKAKDGLTALTKLRHYGTAISVVLLDLMMPGMDGYEVLRRMQQEENTRTIPVIVVSADEDRETALKVIRAGASDLVAKPVDADILRLRVESAVSKTENERLRAQNSYLSVRNTEVNSYKAALEFSGILVITLDWKTGGFTYSPSVSRRLAGQYDGKRLWRVLLSDMVTDSLTVQKIQQLVHDVAEDRERMEGSMRVRLKTTEEVFRMFDLGVFKEVNEYGLADKMILTLRELAPGLTEG